MRTRADKWIKSQKPWVKGERVACDLDDSLLISAGYISRKDNVEFYEISKKSIYVADKIIASMIGNTITKQDP